MKVKLNNYLLLIAIGIIWGGQFVLNEIGLQNYTPEVVALGRAFFGGVFLLILCFFIKKPAKKKNIIGFKTWFSISAIAICEAVIPFVSIVWGQQFLDSSVTAVLMGMIPFITILLVAIFIKKEKVRTTQWLSVILGFIGLLALLWPSLIASGGFGNLKAEAAILLGATSFSVALILIRNLPPINPLILTRNVFIIATIFLFIIFGSLGYLNHLSFNLKAIIAIVILGAICSGLVYIMYVVLIKRAGAAFASLSNYLVPVFGAIFGVFLLKDELSINIIMALTIIIIAVIVSSFHIRKK